MVPSKNNFFDHVRWLRAAVQAQGGELLITGDSLQALIRRGNDHWLLLPHFLASTNGQSSYVPQITDDVTHFAGWLPYRGRRWPAATDKLIFKRFAVQAGLRTPECSVDAQAQMNDIVVKRATSSFGAQIKGPFRASAECPLNVAQGEYYERFVEGDILKIWYWNASPIALEIDDMPTVTGDGHSTFDVLIRKRATLMQKQSEERLVQFAARSSEVLRHCGKSLDDVPARGTKQIVEFRYGSELMHPRGRRVVDLTDEAQSGWQILRTAGSSLVSALPEAMRADTLFTVDAVRDRKRQVWLLEMNSNPTVHPLAYRSIVSGLMSRGRQPAPSPLSARTPETV